MTLTVKRWAISLFVIVHLAAVAITNLPHCALRRVLDTGWADVYLLPTGLWQNWAMFAPEPAHDTVTLEAVVRDSRGLVRNYAFPRMMDQSVWTGFYGGYRHSKYANNLGMPDSVANREFAARFVVRALKLRATDFPADVQLVFQVWPTPAPDATPETPPKAPWTSVIQTYNFPNLAETLP